MIGSRQFCTMLQQKDINMLSSLLEMGGTLTDLLTNQKVKPTQNGKFEVSDDPDAYYLTPLQYVVLQAANYERIKDTASSFTMQIFATDMLLHGAADVNNDGELGVSPLHLAVSQGLTGMSQLFLSLGAKPYSVAKNELSIGKTPALSALQLESSEKAVEMLIMLENNGEDLSHYIFDERFKEHLEKVMDVHPNQAEVIIEMITRRVIERIDPKKIENVLLSNLYMHDTIELPLEQKKSVEELINRLIIPMEIVGEQVIQNTKTKNQRTAPEGTVNERSAMERSAMERSAMERTAMERTAPEETVNERSAMERSINHGTTNEPDTTEETIDKGTTNQYIINRANVNAKFVDQRLVQSNKRMLENPEVFSDVSSTNSPPLQKIFKLDDQSKEPLVVMVKHIEALCEHFTDTPKDKEFWPKVFGMKRERVLMQFAQELSGHMMTIYLHQLRNITPKSLRNQSVDKTAQGICRLLLTLKPERQILLRSAEAKLETWVFVKKRRDGELDVKAVSLDKHDAMKIHIQPLPCVDIRKIQMMDVFAMLYFKRLLLAPCLLELGLLTNKVVPSYTLQPFMTTHLKNDVLRLRGYVRNNLLNNDLLFRYISGREYVEWHCNKFPDFKNFILREKDQEMQNMDLKFLKYTQSVIADSKEDTVKWMEHSLYRFFEKRSVRSNNPEKKLRGRRLGWALLNLKKKNDFKYYVIRFPALIPNLKAIFRVYPDLILQKSIDAMKDVKVFSEKKKRKVIEEPVEKSDMDQIIRLLDSTLDGSHDSNAKRITTNSCMWEL